MPLRTSLESLVGSTLVVAPPDGWVDGPQDWLDELQPAGCHPLQTQLAGRRGRSRVQRSRVCTPGRWRAARRCWCAPDEEGGFVTQTSAWIPYTASARALAWAGGSRK
jgi:hypothetical protein